MINNIKINTEYKSQFLVYCTYYSFPRANNNYKLYILLAFNKSKNNSYLCCISLIQNENIETFKSIYEYLNKNYKLDISLIACDCSLI